MSTKLKILAELLSKTNTNMFIALKTIQIHLRKKLERFFFTDFLIGFLSKYRFILHFIFNAVI